MSSESQPTFPQRVMAKTPRELGGSVDDRLSKLRTLLSKGTDAILVGSAAQPKDQPLVTNLQKDLGVLKGRVADLYRLGTKKSLTDINGSIQMRQGRLKELGEGDTATWEHKKLEQELSILSHAKTKAEFRERMNKKTPADLAESIKNRRHLLGEARKANKDDTTLRWELSELSAIQSKQFERRIEGKNMEELTESIQTRVKEIDKRTKEKKPLDNLPIEIASLKARRGQLLAFQERIQKKSPEALRDSIKARQNQLAALTAQKRDNPGIRVELGILKEEMARILLFQDLDLSKLREEYTRRLRQLDPVSGNKLSNQDSIRMLREAATLRKMIEERMDHKSPNIQKTASANTPTTPASSTAPDDGIIRKAKGEALPTTPLTVQDRIRLARDTVKRNQVGVSYRHLFGRELTDAEYLALPSDLSAAQIQAGWQRQLRSKEKIPTPPPPTKSTPVSSDDKPTIAHAQDVKKTSQKPANETVESTRKAAHLSMDKAVAKKQQEASSIYMKMFGTKTPSSVLATLSTESDIALLSKKWFREAFATVVLPVELPIEGNQQLSTEEMKAQRLRAFIPEKRKKISNIKQLALKIHNQEYNEDYSVTLSSLPTLIQRESGSYEPIITFLKQLGVSFDGFPCPVSPYNPEHFTNADIDTFRQTWQKTYRSLGKYYHPNFTVPPNEQPNHPGHKIKAHFTKLGITMSDDIYQQFMDNVFQSIEEINTLFTNEATDGRQQPRYIDSIRTFFAQLQKTRGLHSPTP